MAKTELSKLLDLLVQIRENDPCTSSDIETRGAGSTTITSVAFTVGGSQQAVAIPLAGGYFKPESEDKLWEEIARVYRTVPIIGQNWMFDWGVLWDNGIRQMTLEWDTMVAQHLLFTDFPRSLEAMISLYTDRSHHKHMIGTDLYTYNAFDVITTWEVMDEQKKRMDEQDMECMRHLMRLHPALITMEKRGILTDMRFKEEALQEMREEQRQLEAKLNEVAGRELNPRSAPQLQKYFYEDHNIKPYRDKKTGRPRVDHDALQRLVQRGFLSAELIMQIREIGKLVSNYFGMDIDNDNRLRCQIKLTGTVTGRLATSKTSKGTGGNLQNLPPRFGYCMVADPGYIFIEADLEQAEKRLVALITGDEQDIADFKAGVDIHSRQAALVLGKDMEEVTKEERNKLGKPLNHATSYDVGPNTFAQTAGIPNARGKAILDAYHRKHPKLRQHFAEIRKHLASDTTLRNLFGRPRRFYGFRDDTLHRSAYDYCPQSTTGEICNRALEYLFYNAPDWLLLLMQKHDSVLIEVPDDFEHVWEACQWLEHALHYSFTVGENTLDVPVAFSLMYRWDKRRAIEADSNTEEGIRRVYEQLQEQEA